MNPLQLIIEPQLNISPHINKKKLNYNPPQMQILRYMGNKRNLLEWLIPKLLNNINEGEIMLDLFAGTSSVGYALKPKVRIIANDIQQYSKIISESLLNFNGYIDDNEFNLYLAKNYNKNFKELENRYYKALIAEKESLSDDLNNDFDYSDFIPTYNHDNIVEDKFSLLQYVSDSYIKRKRNNSRSFPYILFSAYFSNNFFGIRQGIEIDSLRYAIDQISHKQKREVYLTCLLYAISKAVNSSGHFAEHLNIHSENSRKLIREHKLESVLKHFQNKLIEFKKVYRQNRWENKVYNYDYKKLIEHLKKTKEIEKIKLIYIDPPYTPAQYSRYYHIPETLVKYDYPYITIDKRTNKAVKGIYRTDRLQSSFSHITQAEKSFREMFSILAEVSKAPLAISYSDNSIIKPIDDLIGIASEFYNVTNVKNGYSHSAQGSKFTASGKGNHNIHEYLLICKPK